MQKCSLMRGKLLSCGTIVSRVLMAGCTSCVVSPETQALTPPPGCAEYRPLTKPVSKDVIPPVSSSEKRWNKWHIQRC